MKLKSRPRLYISSEHYNRLASAPDLPVLQLASKQVAAQAREFLSRPTIEVDETGHNYHLIRARIMQARIVTFVVEWKRTGNAAYRAAILDDVRRMNEWEYWSWIKWQVNDPNPNAIFDLSYGENSATLAIAFDALHDVLSDDEISFFVEVARRRSLQPYLHQMSNPKTRPSFYSSPNSNWNTVCNGGAGMLALAMWEYCDEARGVLKLADAGIRPFFNSLGQSGAWPEGIGYWNYGMRYGFMYLLSHENASGKPHPLLQQDGTRATLLFPLLFSPNGVPCSFGDVNNFSPLPFHLLAAERTGQDVALAELQQRYNQIASETNNSSKGLSNRLQTGYWPNLAELLLFYPRIKQAAQSKSQPQSRSKIKLYPRGALLEGLEWGYLGDMLPNPSLYVSVRGGTLDAPHTHRDLLSFFCVVNREKLIDNVPVDEYIDTTFGVRREELYEVSAASKNTVFINGVGVESKSDVQTSWICGQNYEGFRFDATAAFSTAGRGAAPLFCGRLLMMLQQRALLIVDRVELAHAGLFESRLHTFARAKFENNEVLISGKKEKLHLTFAASQPALLKRGLGMPTHPPREADTHIRYLSRAKVHHMTIAYLLTPNGRSELTLTESAKSTLLEGSGDITFRLKLDHAPFNLSTPRR